jgi:colicin import membrane protein
MSDRTRNAFILSALMHAVIVALIFLGGYVAMEPVKDQAKIFELVAGPGNNYAATVAAALGTPDGIKVSIPDPPKPAPPVVEPVPPAPEPSPIVAAPIEEPPPPKPIPAPAPVPKPPAPTTPSATAPAKPEKAPDFAADVKRIATKRATRLEAQYKQKLAAEALRRQKAEEAAAKIKHIDAAGIRQGVIGGSQENKVGGAGGKALTREEMDLNESYFALLKARLKENHEKPPGVSDTLTATVAFFVSADGAISRPRIVKSSRNAEFDRSVMDAIRKTESIGKRPDGKGDEVKLDFKMRDEDAN